MAKGAAFIVKERLKKKKKEKEEKREGERGELIFQAWFEDLKHVLGCNLQSKSLYLLIW